MWSKHKKLKEWVAAGLMTEGQSNAIHEYEAARKHGNFGRNLVGLSLFAILVGILSIIASNWNAIPGSVKIGAHGLLNIAIGFSAYIAFQKNKLGWSEGLTFAFFGLTLTLIILIGQVFQLDGSHAGALLFWMLASLPFMLMFSQTRFTAVPWMIAFLTTLYVNLFHYVDVLSVKWEGVFYHGTAILLPLAMMADGRIGFFRKFKPVWADMFVKVGMVLLCITASTATIFWGEEFRNNDLYKDGAYLAHLSIYVIAFVATVIFTSLQDFSKDDGTMKAGILFAFVSTLLCMLVYIFPMFGHEVLRAIAFIAYWVFIGWLAQNAGFTRIVSFAIAVIAIRIFAVYLELFGSLMDTGIGLIVGGVVMLGLIALARRINRRVLAQKGQGGHAI